MVETKEEINFFAKTNFRNKERPFGIKTDDRRRHFYTLGKTGMGKTSMIQNMAIQDIRSGKGLAIVDPHGEFAEECLKAVPEERIKDVIYFNPADLEYPISLNILEKVDPEHRHLVSSGLIGIFKKLWADSWGPRLEYILRNAILALLSHPSSTLLGINRLLVDKQYREEVLSYVDDPVVSSFWKDEFSKYNDRLLTEAISPIQNKVGQFLSSGLIRNIVGQTKSSFSVREAMDSNKILILNLSKGRIGEDSSALLGAMMITKIQLAAMSRVDIPEAERKDFYLYVDEFQNFATESFAGILSEARKYRLSLILAHQFMAQLDESVMNAVLGNVGTIVAFRVGAMDAEILEKEFEPVFYANDLVNLDKYNIYLKLMIDGVATRPFSATTLMPIDTSDTAENLEKVIEMSRRQYAHDRATVERRIMEWSGMRSGAVSKNIESLAKNRIRDLVKGSANVSAQKSVNDDQNRNKKGKGKGQAKKGAGKAKVTKTDALINELGIGLGEETVGSSEGDLEVGQSEVSPINAGREEGTISGEPKANKKKKAKPAEEKQQTRIKVNCSGCGIETEVNFQPDGVRPVFCPECLKEYRRQQAKLKQEMEMANSASAQINESGQTKDKSNVNRPVLTRKKEAKKTSVDTDEVKRLIQEAIDGKK